MTGLFSLLLAYLSLTAAVENKDKGNSVTNFINSFGNSITEKKNDSGSVGQFVGAIGRGITKEIAAAKSPIEETLVTIGSSQCSHVKKLLGVAYEQLDGEKEPDLNKLALEFRDRSIRIIFNITSAAQLIPKSEGYDPNKKLIIFVHGFTDDPSQSGFRNISEALLSNGECNVLALDGSSLIKWLYLRSTSYVRFMGEKLGETLASMVHSGVDPKSIHIIGHSLGAHISGFTGKTFQELTGTKVARISGLDPAGPCFSHVDDELRLKATDADFVDVIHTDAGVYGLKDAVGHADFFPNSGSDQPDCFAQSCSHSRAWLYYAESVYNPQAFPARKCKDWDAFKKGQCESTIYNMGYSCPSKTRGQYYLQTGREPPYNLGDKGMNFVNNEGIIKNIGSLLGR